MDLKKDLSKDLPPKREDPPLYIRDYLRVLNRFARRDRWLIRRFLPAPKLVHVIIAFYRKRRTLGKRLERYMTMDESWSMKYGPRNHLHVIEWEGRKRTFSFLIGALRMHRKTLSSRISENPHGQDRHALEVLDAVGLWWKDNRRSNRVRMREKRALDLCARIYDHRLAN